MERALEAAAAKHLSKPASPRTSQSTTPSELKPQQAEPASVPTSSALAYIPAPFPEDLDASTLDKTILRDIQPWDLQSPLPVSDCQPLFYDAATQEYYLFTCEGALLLHKTQPIMLTKRKARKFMYDWPQGNDAVQVLGKKLKVPKSSSPLISCKMIIYHAVHDSVIVKRNSGNTGLFRFCVDKVVKVANPGFLMKDVYTQFVRPEFGCVLKCTCPQVYYYGRTVYCPTCTSYRTPLCINLNNLTPKAPRVVGKLTMPIPIARIILHECAEPGTTKLSIPLAYKALVRCFSMHNVSKIPLKEEELVGNLLRDCLFVETESGRSSSSAKKGKDKVQPETHKVCWATFFNIPDREIPRGRCPARGSVGSGHEHGSLPGVGLAALVSA
ncbi:hypothetical protein BJX68DRAFT_268248 [Aspergillus pseudodeflectus]|uniref:Uncharacterized protein n=1 Tax=Aspergillus pseudodeflectus TaxID=176178 RepID=A0ABR4K4Y4_9EURO